MKYSFKAYYVLLYAFQTFAVSIKTDKYNNKTWKFLQGRTLHLTGKKSFLPSFLISSYLTGLSSSVTYPCSAIHVNSFI